MKQVGALAVGLWLSMVGSLSWALDLGPAQVNSSLDARLEATLPLVDSGSYPRSSFDVSVADQSDFESAGVEWTPLAGSVQVAIEERQGQRVVVLTSDAPVTSPWLDLLLTVSSPDGQQTQEITLLFDPPDYAVRGESANREPVAQPSPAERASTTASQNPVATQGDAYVRSGDTLWSVAARTKPAQASVQQMMLALLEANPSAFPSGNIHQMRAAQRLTLPDDSRVMARSPDQAADTIRAMNAAWQRRDENGPDPVALPEVASGDDSATPNEANDSDAETVEANRASAAPAASSGTDANSAEAPLIDPTVVSAVRVLANMAPSASSSSSSASSASLEDVPGEQWQQERDAMRRELAALREEVARLSDVVATQQRSPAEAASLPIVERLGDYQWWLLLSALLLLVGLLITVRRRRQQWETPPPMAATGAEKPQKPSSGATGSSRVSPSVSSVPPSQETPAVSPSAVSEMALTVDISQPSPEQTAPEQAATEYTAYDASLDRAAMVNTQAAGLIEIGQERRLALKALPAGHDPELWLAPPAKPHSVAAMLSAMGYPSTSEDAPVATPEPAATPEEAAVPESELERTSLRGSQDGAWMIDYQPPTLASEKAARQETPMQPTVEFDAQREVPPSSPAAREPEWDIEEVAFAPTPRDNSAPSTPGNVDKRR
ncbi:type IV pilus assembly protein FimV [Vreelandella arcis]|uniref:Pilus assembly protein FimV n=1 Tax=Vreelandella arcis TaxID=416873 RepID=A0A1H0F4C0_9GAMM|nr:FimV/HubP family polar landmark protein [Halomonas arcis]SDN89514.1 pilus assembly protein FimV [Halomonas arcis]